MRKWIKFAPWDKWFLMILILMVMVFVMEDSFFSLWFYKPFQNDEISVSQEAKDTNKKYRFGVVTFLGSVGDTEQAIYRCMAATKRDLQCYTFFYKPTAEVNLVDFSVISKVQNIINYFFKPDFIIHSIPSKAYKRNKDIPAYLIINYDITDAFRNPDKKGRFTDFSVLKNITQYDGFILYNLDDNWFKDFHNVAQKRLKEKVSNLYLANQHSSVYLLNYHEKPFKKITYTGHNWDKLRSSQHYQDIFNLLGETGDFEAYGPYTGWKFASQKYYKGFLPQDGHSILDKQDANGISLILHSDLHLDKNLYSSNRLFEAASVSNLIITDNHSFIRKEFGSCVFFIDPKLKAEKVVRKIHDIFTWAQSNPAEAMKKAKCAHDIFAAKFSLEDQTDQIIKMHEKFLAGQAQELR